ncbi:hypothetical protein D3C71_1876200 [compost metagenome]
MQQAGNTIGDRQAKTKSLPAAVLAAPELLEYALLFFLGNTGPGVMHFNAHAAVFATYTEQDAAVAGVTHRIGQEILQHTP